MKTVKKRKTLFCKKCGKPIPYRSAEAYDDRCDDCIEKGGPNRRLAK